MSAPLSPADVELVKDAANFCALHGNPEHAAAIRRALAALPTVEMPRKESPLPAEVQALARAGRKMDAIRLMRLECPVDLKVAKDLVEAFLAHEALLASARPSQTETTP